MSAHTTSHPADPALLDISATVGEYLHRSDWRVNANANQGYSLGGLILNTAGKVIANYLLNEVYTPEIGQAHRQADLHIHDLDMLSGYCAGWSLRTLLHEGLNGVPGKVEAAPPPGLQLLRHLPGAVYPQGQPGLRHRAPVHPGVCLQPERAIPLGHPDSVHQHHHRLGLPGRPAGTAQARQWPVWLSGTDRLPGRGHRQLCTVGLPV